MSTEIQFSVPIPPSINEVLAPFMAETARGGAVDWAAVIAALVAREEGIADVMRLAGQSFGLLPQIVAEVFALIQFGEPISAEQRVLIHNQFHQVIRTIQEGGDPFAPPSTDN